ncbi:MAG: hypothetical protein IK017_12245 [Paludibacteraceae bacterium]|nr:hypothetical protein [Paludibacteraceae bacterium]
MGIFDFLFNRKKENEGAYDKSEQPSNTRIYDNSSEKDSIDQSNNKQDLPSLDNIPENILNEAKELVRQGYKLNAVKLIVDNTSAGLKEAKEFVDNITL